LINTEEAKNSPIMAKKINIVVNIWKHLIRKGATLLETWKETPKSQGNAFEHIKDTLMNVLKSKLENYLIDPPLPVVGMVRDEFNAYQKTMLQEYLYEFLFRETDDELENNITSTLKTSPLYTDERLTPEQFEFDIKGLVDEVLN